MQMYISMEELVIVGFLILDFDKVVIEGDCSHIFHGAYSVLWAVDHIVLREREATPEQVFVESYSL